MAFDVDALRQKYAFERDRRLRADGIAQYLEIAGPFAGFRQRPLERSALHARSVVRRGRCRDHRRRFRGSAHRRPAAGTGRAAASGSSTRPPTWAAPGTGTGTRASRVTSSRMSTCRCWRSWATSRPRNTPRATRSSRTADASPNTTTCTAMPACRPRSAKSAGMQQLSRWIISTNHGDAIRARFVAMANGYLQKPKLPGIEGITASSGHAFHTSRWDYDYTGPDLAKLSDKRVGIIGTGATAIQCVPHLAQIGRSSCSSSSAHRRPSMCAATGRPIRIGRQTWKTAGSTAASRTSSCSPPAVRPKRTWSTTPGRASSRSSS